MYGQVKPPPVSSPGRGRSPAGGPWSCAAAALAAGRPQAGHPAVCRRTAPASPSASPAPWLAGPEPRPPAAPAGPAVPDSQRQLPGLRAEGRQASLADSQRLLGLERPPWCHQSWNLRMHPRCRCPPHQMLKSTAMTGTTAQRPPARGARRQRLQLRRALPQFLLPLELSHPAASDSLLLLTTLGSRVARLSLGRRYQLACGRPLMRLQAQAWLHLLLWGRALYHLPIPRPLQMLSLEAQQPQAEPDQYRLPQRHWQVNEQWIRHCCWPQRAAAAQVKHSG